MLLFPLRNLEDLDRQKPGVPDDFPKGNRLAPIAAARSPDRRVCSPRKGMLNKQNRLNLVRRGLLARNQTLLKRCTFQSAASWPEYALTGGSRLDHASVPYSVTEPHNWEIRSVEGAKHLRAPNGSNMMLLRYFP